MSSLRVTFTSILFSLVTLLGYGLVVPTALAQLSAEAPPEAICTMDVMECPDGSSVGRTGPQCEFICPTEAKNDTDDTSPTTNTVTSGSSTETSPDQKATSLLEENPRRTEKQAVLSELRQARITNLAANISNQTDAVIERFLTIISRLESRIQNLKQFGVDTNTAESILRSATQKLAEAQSLMINIDSLVYNATTSEKPYTNWQTLKEHYIDVILLLRNTQEELRAVISSLKEASIPPRPNYSTDQRSNTAALPDTL